MDTKATDIIMIALAAVAGILLPISILLLIPLMGPVFLFLYLKWKKTEPEIMLGVMLGVILHFILLLFVMYVFASFQVLTSLGTTVSVFSKYFVILAIAVFDITRLEKKFKQRSSMEKTDVIKKISASILLFMITLSIIVVAITEAF